MIQEHDLACQASKKKWKAGSSTEKEEPTFTLLDSWEKQRPLLSLSREHKALTSAVDMLPLSTVDKPGFRAML